MLKSLLLMVVGVRQLVLAQFDPISNFCRRIDTQGMFFLVAREFDAGYILSSVLFKLRL